MRNRAFLLFLVCVATVGCGDDASSADGGGSSSSTTAGPTTSGSAGDDTTAGSTDTSATTGSDSSSSGSETGSASSGSTSDSSSSGETTGGSNEACENGGQLVLTWNLLVPDGVYPDDIPADLDESCEFTPSMTPGDLPLSCTNVDLLLNIDSDPPVALPVDAQSVGVRVHRQAGPYDFPDFWVELSFADGQRFTLISSSVLVPNNDTVELPFGMTRSDQECGPFNVGSELEPEDPCGDQMWLGLDLTLDEPLTVFHGTYESGTSEGNDVGVWVETARDYGTIPEFCDIPITFFTAMVVSG